jgi:crotonobetaine/carnitine-CoA ligase
MGATDPDGVLPCLVRARAAEQPDEPILHDVDGGSLTFGELHRQAIRWAEALAGAGVGPGGVVASMLPNCVEHYAVWLGVGWLRGLEVPVNVELRGSVLHHVLRSARVEVLVVAPGLLGRIRDLAGDLPDLRTVVVLDPAPLGPAPLGPAPLDPAPLGPEPRWAIVGRDTFLAASSGTTTFERPRPHDVSSVLFTSGTTGPAKGVLVSWAQLHAGIGPTIRFSTNDGADRFYACGSPSHVVSKAALATMTVTRGQLFVRPAFSLSEFWGDVRRFGIRSTVLVGAMADFLLAAPPEPGDATTTLTNVLMVPVTRRVEEFNARFGTRVWTAYNMTETSVPLTSDGWTVDSVSCGRLRTGYPFYQARLVDEFDQEVGPGQVGELILRTGVPWTLNSGYLNHPEATAAAWRNGWFHTGDAFRCDEAGRYTFVDRMKDTIRRRGENISSFEVEAEVLAHPGVAECAAVAVAADEAEDEIKVVVVRRPDSGLTAAELVEFLGERVPRFMVPRYVQFAAELPRTPTLRVQKALLREPVGPVWDRLHPS